MIKIDKPTISQKDIFHDCLLNVRKQSIKKNILLSQGTIEIESENYDKLAQVGKLSTILSNLIINGGATKDDMVWLYDKKFVAGGGRKYYDLIMNIPSYGRCPFCGLRRVKTLDHYLAKTEYPTFAVTPFNLVASCSDCNKIKNNMIFKKKEEELIHPYYDDFDDEIWLKTKINGYVEISFGYYVEKPKRWSEEKFLRAKNHFDKLELNKLYMSHAGEEFSEYEGSLKKLYFTGKEELVRLNLMERVEEKRSIKMNSWQAAMYDGLLSSSWFFEEYLYEKFCK